MLPRAPSTLWYVLENLFIKSQIYKYSSYVTENTLLLHKKTKRLMMFSETIATYVWNHKNPSLHKHTHTTEGKITAFLTLQQLLGLKG
jgi:hypothetical protein